MRGLSCKESWMRRRIGDEGGDEEEERYQEEPDEEGGVKEEEWDAAEEFIGSGDSVGQVVLFEIPLPMPFWFFG